MPEPFTNPPVPIAGNASRKRRSGVALILVLLLLALLIVVVYSFAYSTRVNRRLARNRAADLQVTYLGKAGVEVAKALLGSDSEDNGHDWLGDKWAERLPPVRLEEAVIRVRIVDEDRKVNINALALDRNSLAKTDVSISDLREPIRERIVRAIVSLGLPIDAASLGAKIEERVALGDTEHAQNPTYPFIGRPYHSVEELLELDGIDGRTLYGNESDGGAHEPGLADVLTVVGGAGVNVNTASKGVLMALAEEVDERMAEAILEHRAEVEGLKASAELESVPGLTKEIAKSLARLTTTQSAAFSLTVTVDRGALHRTIRALLQRPLAGPPPKGTPRLPLLIPGLKTTRILRWEEIR